METSHSFRHFETANKFEVEFLAALRIWTDFRRIPIQESKMVTKIKIISSSWNFLVSPGPGRLEVSHSLEVFAKKINICVSLIRKTYSFLNFEYLLKFLSLSAWAWIRGWILATYRSATLISISNNRSICSNFGLKRILKPLKLSHTNFRRGGLPLPRTEVSTWNSSLRHSRVVSTFFFLFFIKCCAFFKEWQNENKNNCRETLISVKYW